MPNTDNLLYELEMSDVSALIPQTHKLKTREDAKLKVYSYNADGENVTLVVEKKETIDTLNTSASATYTQVGSPVSGAPDVSVVTVDNSARTVKVTVDTSGKDAVANGDSIKVTVTAQGSAAELAPSTGEVTLTYTDGSWSTATVTVTPEYGSAVPYTVTVA